MIIKVMVKKINFKALLGAITALMTAHATATGEILNYINFADPLNEMAFCVLCLMLGIGCLMGIKK